MTIFAQKPIPGGWVRLYITEDSAGGMWWETVGGRFTATPFPDALPDVCEMRPMHDVYAGNRVTPLMAERISGVTYPVCMDWIRDRM